MKFNTLNRVKTFFILALISPSIYAEKISIGTVSDGPLAKVGKFFQQIVDFLGGPGTLFAVFVALCAGVILWITMPKQAGSALGWVFRAMIGGIFLFSMGVAITWLKSL